MRAKQIYLTGKISIHAPREGSDGWHEIHRTSEKHFYPRSPRGERPGTGPLNTAHHHFYPRSPRGERPAALNTVSASLRFLSTLPARGATYVCPPPAHGSIISIHAPREGSDAILFMCSSTINQFLSTLPARGATAEIRRPEPHADFYPRSPRGERPRAGVYPDS